MSERLALAQESYQRGDYLRAFSLCKEILDHDPQCVDALILFARLCLDAGERVIAVQTLQLVVHLAPDRPEARVLLRALGGPYDRAVQIDPGLEHHTNAFVFAATVPQAEVVEQ